MDLHSLSIARVAITARRFWHFLSLDVRSLAAFRIVLASIILIDLLWRASDITAFYSDDGILPRSLLLDGITHQWNISLHLVNGTPFFQVMLFLLAAVFACPMLVGYEAKLATAISWVLLLSLHVRNPAILNSGDTYLRMLAFWAIALPTGQVWSVDARRQMRISKAVIENGTIADNRRPSLTVAVATLALYAQVAVMYISTGLLKSNVPAWQSGDAVAIALSKGIFTSRFGLWISAYPDCLQLLSRATLWLELLGPLALVATRGLPRLIVILVFVIFHCGLAMCFHIGLFPVVCIAALVPFLPPDLWNYFQGDARTQTRMLGEINDKKQRPATAQAEAACKTRQTIRESCTVAMLSVALIISLWSSMGIVFKQYAIPKSLFNLGAVFKWNQSWDMFVSLDDNTPDGWFVVHGQLANGHSVNLMTGDSNISYDEPAFAAESFKSARWRKLYSNLRADRYESMRTTFGRFIRRQWDANHDPQNRLRRLRVYYVRYEKDSKKSDETGGFSTLVFNERYETRRPVRKFKIYGWKSPEI